MSTNRATRVATILVAAVLIVAGCGDKDPKTTSTAATGAGTSQSSAPAANGPSLPGVLPKFTSADDTEQTMRTIIQMAVTYAKNTPDADRNPEVVQTSEFICGVRLATGVCSPTTADEKVVIYIDTETAWEQFNEPIGHGGGDTVMQDRAISSAMNYLFFREMQRSHPDLLTTTDTSKGSTIRSVQLCVEGRVIGGLAGQHVMSAELTELYAALYTHDEVKKGARGEC